MYFFLLPLRISVYQCFHQKEDNVPLCFFKLLIYLLGKVSFLIMNTVLKYLKSNFYTEKRACFVHKCSPKYTSLLCLPYGFFHVCPKDR